MKNSLIQIDAFKLLIVSLMCLSLASCTPRKSPFGDKSGMVTVETPEEQAIQEIMDADTRFNLSAAEILPAWERAQAFFTIYLKDELNGSRYSVGEHLISFSGGPQSGYIYEVERQPLNSGDFEITVNCRAKGAMVDNRLAQRNAHNLARFIRQGSLEVSLLAR